MTNTHYIKKAFTLGLTFLFLFTHLGIANAMAPTIGTLTSNQTAINSINETNVSFDLNGITDSDISDDMIYKYSWDGTNYSNLSNTFTEKQFTASEDLSRGDAVYNIPEFTTTLLSEETEGNVDNYYYINGSGEYPLFSFTTSANHENFEKVSLYMRRNFSYAGTNLILRVKSGTNVILDSTIGHNDVPFAPSYQHDWVDFTFSGSLTPSTTYDLALYVSSSAGFSVDRALDSTYTHRVYENKATGFGANAVGKATATDATKSEFVGFVNEDVTAGNPVMVDVAGNSTTQELLGSGSVYYLSDTLGQISTTPGTISKTVGTAISDTTIDLASNNYNDAQITFNLDASAQADTELTLYVKSNDGTDDSNVSTVNITKNSVAPVITITNPVEDPTQQTISAIVDKGTLYKSETRGDICDNTLTFTDYSASTYTLNSDNGMKVCFKAIDSVGNTSYALSTKIWGIAKEDYMGGDIFYGYQNWYTSPYSKANDSSLAILKLMGSTVKTGTSFSHSFPNSFVDINGDGLVDMLYIDTISLSGPGSYTKDSYGIMVNNGDMTFDTVYRCVKYTSSTTGTNYYGDCAE